MKVAEIKVSYTNKNKERVHITNSKKMFELILNHWNLDTIELLEEVKVILFNRSNIVLGVYDLSKGGVSGTVVDFKIILGVALKSAASAIALVHNHPSGKLVPSGADIEITKKLREACKIVDIQLLDHLIISNIGYYSFADSE